MLARIRKAQDNDQEGFTLIELLVVIIIIGILAAIAIPTFLKQREKGYKAAMKSDLKNVTTAQESFATDNNGAYTLDEGLLKDEGYNKSPDVTVVVESAGTAIAPAFVICATHAKLPTTTTFKYSSATGAITATTVACVAG